MSTTTTNDAPRYSPLGQLIGCRMREFSREPEAWLWTYGFPVLMAVALGIAFRNQGVPEIAVAVVENPQAKATRDVDDFEYTGIKIITGSPLFRASESAKGSPGSCTGSGRARKSTKKPLPYAWLAVKPNNMLSSVGQ